MPGLMLTASLGSLSPRFGPAAVPTDSTVILTVDALTRMTTFWSAFQKEPQAVQNPDQIKPDSLELRLDLGSGGQKSFPVEGVNMVALAAKFPSVAADLQQAGLSALQWEQYRQALYDASLSAQVAKASDYTPTPTSGIGRNAAFLDAHPAAVAALQATGMWFPPVRPGMGVDTTVVLTVDLMSKMATFWTSLLAEPPAVLDTAVYQYQTKYQADDAQMEMVAGVDGIALWPGLDIRKLVRRYPSVGADLKRAGLTVQDYENTRKSLNWAWAFVEHPQGPINPDNKWDSNRKFYSQYIGFYAFIMYTSKVLYLF
jgi:hypothetical protein